MGGARGAPEHESLGLRGVGGRAISGTLLLQPADDSTRSNFVRHGDDIAQSDHGEDTVAAATTGAFPWELTCPLSPNSE